MDYIYSIFGYKKDENGNGDKNTKSIQRTPLQKACK